VPTAESAQALTHLKCQQKERKQLYSTKSRTESGGSLTMTQTVLRNQSIRLEASRWIFPLGTCPTVCPSSLPCQSRIAQRRMRKETCEPVSMLFSTVRAASSEFRLVVHFCPNTYQDTITRKRSQRVFHYYQGISHPWPSIRYHHQSRYKLRAEARSDAGTTPHRSAPSTDIA
jgi:hypothetical protein